MPLMPEYLRDIQERGLPQLRKQLEPLESGEMYLGERRGPGPWTDTIQKWVDHLKTTIGIYESILSQHRDEK